jgi:ubiquitin-like protein ATG12
MSESGSATAAASSPLVPAGDKDKDKDKVVVLFKATGDAPILKQQKFKARGERACVTLGEFEEPLSPLSWRRSTAASASPRWWTFCVSSYSARAWCACSLAQKACTLSHSRATRQFVYLRSAFVPCLDDTVASLFSAFGEEGKLVVHYANTPAWG